MSFDYLNLPREFPRSFLPPKVDWTDRSHLESLFDDLQKRQINSKDDLEKWLQNISELSAAIWEERGIRYIRMTCQTDDKEREKAYMDFVDNIEPKVKLWFFHLNRKFLDTPARKQLSRDRYFVFDRGIENVVSLFREENIDLEKQETKLSQRYQKIIGAMTVFYDGRERTLQQMARYLEQPGQDTREETWRLSTDRRLKDRELIDQLYDELVVLRQSIAKNAGFENYRGYAFRKRERFEYSPEDCFRFHETVEQHIVPLLRTLDESRKNKLKVDPLRPWDLVVDPQGRQPLRPFNTATELVQGCAKIYDKIDPEFGRSFRRIAELGLLDLESRMGKAPGGYNFALEEIRLPFIFMNGVGRDDDVHTLLHESGHAFHTFATRNEPLRAYRHSPTEFAEVASMTMDLLATERLEGTFYNHEDAGRSKREHLDSIVRLLAWVATIDAFQHWVYTNPGHSRQEREEAWLKIHARFGGIESWEGFQQARRSFWHRQLHLFTHPFYYIEYGIAQLGALGIWTRYRKDARGAVEAYKRALALGGSKSLPDLFRAADLPFDFGPSTIEPYARELRSELSGSEN